MNNETRSRAVAFAFASAFLLAAGTLAFAGSSQALRRTERLARNHDTGIPGFTRRIRVERLETPRYWVETIKQGLARGASPEPSRPERSRFKTWKAFWRAVRAWERLNAARSAQPERFFKRTRREGLDASRLAHLEHGTTDAGLKRQHELASRRTRHTSDLINIRDKTDRGKVLSTILLNQNILRATGEPKALQRLYVHDGPIPLWKLEKLFPYESLPVALDPKVQAELLDHPGEGFPRLTQIEEAFHVLLPRRFENGVAITLEPMHWGSRRGHGFEGAVESWLAILKKARGLEEAFQLSEGAVQIRILSDSRRLPYYLGHGAVPLHRKALTRPDQKGLPEARRQKFYVLEFGQAVLENAVKKAASRKSRNGPDPEAERALRLLRSILGS